MSCNIIRTPWWVFNYYLVYDTSPDCGCGFTLRQRGSGPWNWWPVVRLPPWWNETFDVWPQVPTWIRGLSCHVFQTVNSLATLQKLFFFCFMFSIFLQLYLTKQHLYTNLSHYNSFFYVFSRSSVSRTFILISPWWLRCTLTTAKLSWALL